MKRCPECYAIYEVYLDICPACGEPLSPYDQTMQHRGYIKSERDNHTGSPDSGMHKVPMNPMNDQRSRIFIVENGRNILINGVVVESSTQQYYQSKFTRFFHAVFSGEPYQFSHTTFVTIFRVEEHIVGRYPEHAMDVTLYGNMQNLFAVGDDLSITGRRKGRGVVAKSIYNHSISSPIRIQPYIPSGVIRGFVMMVVTSVLNIIYGILTADYAALFDSLLDLVSGMISMGFLMFMLWYLLKEFFKKG